MRVTKNLLHALPKADLHVHLDGSLRPATMVELARERGKPLPTEDPHELARRLRAHDTTSLEQYLARFRLTLSLMQDAPAIERIAYELAQDSAAENVRYLEVRFSPLLNTGEGLTTEEAVQACLRGLERAEREHPVRTATILCGIRDMDPRSTLELADLAISFRTRGVVALDLAGAEAGHPARDHAAAFERAARANLAVTVHAGEADGPESIRQALHECGARRLGHGTRLLEDPELMGWVRDFRVPLEVCLTSNVQTGAAPSFGDHPFRVYHERGLVVTLNTDNRLVSGTTLTDEYWHAHADLGLGWDELARTARTGFESAFLPWPEKRELVASVTAEIEALGG